MPHHAIQGALAGLAIMTATNLLDAQSPDLEDFYGFDGLEVVRIDPGAGPIDTGDLDGDGHADLIVVNNYKNRIEIHHQKPDASFDDESFQPQRANDLPEHWRFRRVQLPAVNRVTAIVPHDFNGDGLMDLVYAGQDPGAIVFLEQSAPGEWKVARRHFINGLMASRDGIAIEDVIGDESPEILAVTKGRINVWPMEGDALGQEIELTGGDTPLAAFFIEDADGNGLNDVYAVSPDDSAPVRLWLAEGDQSDKSLGAQLRFEMPPLREATAIRLPDQDRSLLAVIEKPSKRVALFELDQETVSEQGDREAAYEVFSFMDPGNRGRSVEVADLFGDGASDVLATNTDANAIAIYRNTPQGGLAAPILSPAYSDLSGLTTGDLDGDGSQEVYMLSENEGVVGRSVPLDGRLSFPEVVPVSSGYEPVATNVVKLDDGERLAVVTKSGRKYALDLIGTDGVESNVDLGSMSRAPQTVMAVDADRDGTTDLVLLTPERSATLLLGDKDGFSMVEKPGQEKLLRAAGPMNTAVVDFDGDGASELLVADSNFIRALEFNRPDPNVAEGGWEVVDQINAPRSDINLVAIEPLGPDRVAAADRENGRIVIFDRNSEGTWSAGDTITLRGFRFDSLKTGDASGRDEEILAIGSDGFAVVRLGGERNILREVSTWRPEEPREVPHEFGVGDLNEDGLLDIVALDAGQQSARILSLSEARQLLPATAFEVFESRIFSGGEPREFEPRQAIVVDMTGDDREDLVLLAHDRILIYPQDAPRED